MSNEPRQQEIDFPIVFSDAEWGKHETQKDDEEIDDLWERLSQSLKNQLFESTRYQHPTRHLYIYNREIGEKLPHLKVGQASKVMCPFCKKGFLKLVAIEPQHGGGLRGRFGTQKHVGDDYYYGCVEGECRATFCYNITWEHID